MSEPLRAIIGQLMKRKPAPPYNQQTLSCPQGYIGSGEIQQRDVRWDVPTQQWVVGPWYRIAFNCILQPTWLQAYLPGDGSKYGTWSTTWRGLSVPNIVAANISNNRGGYVPNYDIALRGANVSDERCRQLGLNPERVIYVREGDFVHYSQVSYVNHNYGGGFVAIDVNTFAQRGLGSGISKAETKGGWATVTTSATAGFNLNGNTVSAGPICRPNEIVFPYVSNSAVCSGNTMSLQIFRGAIPVFAGSRALSFWALATYQWNMKRWIDLGPIEIYIDAEGRAPQGGDDGGWFRGNALLINVKQRGVLVFNGTNEHSRDQPSITGAGLAVSPNIPFTSGMGEGDPTGNRLPVPVRPGLITFGGPWRPSMCNGLGFAAL